MKRLALLLPLLALFVGVSTVLSCHAARSRNPGAAPSRSTDRIAQALNGATNVMLYASTPGVTRAQRQLTLMGLVEEDEKRRLLEILDRSRPDTWIYVSCRHYLQCDASWFGIYVNPSEPEIGFDWTDFDALSAEATDAHAVFVCTEPELVEWVKDFTAKTRDGQTSPATNAPAAAPTTHAESADGAKEPAP